MAFARIKGSKINTNEMGIDIPEASTYICESEDDIVDLPTDDIMAAVGSTAIVVGTGSAYIKTPTQWMKYNGVSIIH